MTGLARRSDRLLTITAAVAITFAVIGVAVLIGHGWSKEPSNPLGPYPMQHVQNQIPGIAGPAMHVGDVAVITGRLCNRSPKAVPVLTTISWRAIDRTGTFVTVALDLQQVRKPGCEQLTFRNPMTSAVEAAVRATGRSRWVVEGFEIPANQQFRERTTFTSEPFLIVPKGLPKNVAHV